MTPPCLARGGVKLTWGGRVSRRTPRAFATEDNVVHAIDAMSGQELWQRSLGNPVPRSSLPCGNISPLGVTGTPVIDASRQAVFLDAAVEGPSGPRHVVFALSLKDGTPLSGWPIESTVIPDTISS
jgi:outer membrane protein assembly factor BamB